MRKPYGRPRTATDLVVRGSAGEGLSRGVHFRGQEVDESGQEKEALSWSPDEFHVTALRRALCVPVRESCAGFARRARGSYITPPPQVCSGLGHTHRMVTSVPGPEFFSLYEEIR
jgi:hypothetical protein